MSREYRVTLPESRTEHDTQTHADTVHSVRTILWQGDTVPEQSVIDRLMEGQIEKACQPSSQPLQSANYLNIEKRRRMNLGWFVVDRVNIPGA